MTLSYNPNGPWQQCYTYEGKTYRLNWFGDDLRRCRVHIDAMQDKYGDWRKGHYRDIRLTTSKAKTVAAAALKAMKENKEGANTLSDGEIKRLARAVEAVDRFLNG